MNTQKQITWILLCMFVLLPVASESMAESAPPDVIQAAEDGLQPFMKRIPWGERERFGFTKADDPEQAYFGSPYRLHTITPAALSKYQSEDTVESLISETHMWYFPVMLEDECRVILIVDQMDGQWKAVSLGRAKLARQLGKVRKAWSRKRGYDPRLIAVFQAGEYLFTVPEKDSYNLTSLIRIGGKKRSDQATADSDLDELSRTIERLKPLVERNMER